MTKGQGKAFVLAGVMVLCAVARYGMNYVADQRLAALAKAGKPVMDPEVVDAMELARWADFVGGGAVTMAVLCLWAAEKVKWENAWVRGALIGVVVLCQGFLLFG